jgi:hypothetical protein
MTIALEDPTTTSTNTTTSATSTAPSRPGPRSSDRPSSRRLPRPVHKAVLAVHVLSSVGWFGVAVTLAFCALVGGSTDELALYEIIQATLSLSVPLGLAAAVSGIVLSVTTRWGLVRHWWVVAKEAITVAVIATDVLVVGPAMDEAIDTGVPTEMPGPIWAHCIVLAIAAVLSVVKPRARTPLG